VDYYSVDTFDYSIAEKAPLEKRGRGNRGGAKRSYKALVCAFDIETTRLRDLEQAIMYIWQFQIGGYTIIGRTWEEFKIHVQKLEQAITPGVRIVVWVHNLAYEFSFLKGVFEIPPESVFCTHKRKVLKCDIGETIEMRCSYFHSNMNLSLYTEKYCKNYKKIDGYDYDKPRYSWTELSDFEIEYCINDVRGLVEALTNEMIHDHDNLYTIPLTSTGYVRRDIKRCLRNVSHTDLKNAMPVFGVYKLLDEAFRGGNTHANRTKSGEILKNVHSYDLSSAYPYVQCTQEFPISPFKPFDELTPSRIMDAIYTKKRAVVGRFIFYDIRVRKETSVPYLSISKCRECVNVFGDNGRVLESDFLVTTLTDIDLEIVLSQYDFSGCEVEEAYYATYGRLPAPLVNQICEYFRVKTELKGVEEMELFYEKSKNKLNSIYGMSAQRPVKRNIIYSDELFSEDEETPEEQLFEMGIKKAIQPYQWGVWTTAHTRRILQYGIDKAGSDFVYCDTDSVKSEKAIDFADYNKEAKDRSEGSGATGIDRKGNTRYMGTFEEEKTYSRFITWGAKKYAYEYADGKPRITVSGVAKRGANELERAGGLEKFKPGFIFTESAGMAIKYNDNIHISTTIEGRQVEITSNAYLYPTTYVLGLASEYEELLTELKDFCN
jgi:hypothetical protein